MPSLVGLAGKWAQETNVDHYRGLHYLHRIRCNVELTIELILYRRPRYFSAGLNPLSQQVLFAAYPREEHPKAFSWMSSGRMVGDR